MKRALTSLALAILLVGCSTTDRLPPRPESVPPALVERVAPVYPSEMRRSAVSGTVVVKFVVDTEGKVVDPVVAKSSNAGFDKAAIEAVLQWKFRPGLKSGRPARTRLEVPITFTIQPEPDREAEQRYDCEPVYPVADIAQRKAGRAVVDISVDEHGNVAGARIVESSGDEFGGSTLAAAEACVFKPKVEKGKMVGATVRYERLFGVEPNPRPGLVRPSAEDQDFLLRSQEEPATIRKASELDTPLKPVLEINAVPPLTFAKQDGNATVAFFVDEEGRVRLPRAVQCTDPAFGYAAVQALASWRFAPPMLRGQVVAAEARVHFVFNATGEVDTVIE